MRDIRSLLLSWLRTLPDQTVFRTLDAIRNVEWRAGRELLVRERAKISRELAGLVQSGILQRGGEQKQRFRVLGGMAAAAPERVAAEDAGIASAPDAKVQAIRFRWPEGRAPSESDLREPLARALRISIEIENGGVVSSEHLRREACRRLGLPKELATMGPVSRSKLVSMCNSVYDDWRLWGIILTGGSGSVEVTPQFAEEFDRYSGMGVLAEWLHHMATVGGRWEKLPVEHRMRLDGRAWARAWVFNVAEAQIAAAGVR